MTFDPNETRFTNRHDRRDGPDPPAEFAAGGITDAALTHLRKFSTDKIFSHAPRLGDWIFGWIDREMAIRAGLAERDEKHDLCFFSIRDWSGREVSAALEAASAWTFCGLHPECSAFVDRVYNAVRIGIQSRLQEDDQ